MIDNRDLPPEQLRTRAPFTPTDRTKLSTIDTRQYIILDNADLITIKDFDNSEIIETTMLGNVRIRLDDSTLRAEKLVITLQGSTVLNVGAYGRVEFTLSGTKYLAESMNYQPEAERGVLYNVRSILGSFSGSVDDKPLFYQAETVTIESLDRYVLDNVMISTSDTRFNHFTIRVKKLWYLQNKVALALGIEYLAGQASFVWLPAYFQLEGGSGIRTSFGNERRIGYYFINNFTWNTKIGEFDFGFDWYQYQGQYFQTKYSAPSTGLLRQFDIQLDMANDIRLIRNGDVYSQWVFPQNNSIGQYERISQFAWHYEISGAIGTNDMNLNFNFKNLNDPFFLQKYSYRTRFDNSDAIDFFTLPSPGINSWYQYAGDITPAVNSFSQNVSFQTGGLNIGISWDTLRVTRSTTENQFLNDFHRYEIRSLTLPELSYNFGSWDLFSYNYKTQSKFRVQDSSGAYHEIYAYELPMLEKKLGRITNEVIEIRLERENGALVTNLITNLIPVSISNITTNDYNWFDIKAVASARASFRSQKTFGTNNVSLTTDLEALRDTNWQVIDDLNRHEESGTVGVNMSFFDSLLTVNNNINLSYREQWSSFASSFSNNLRESGFRSDYTIATSLSPNKVWNDDSVNRVRMGFNTTVNLSYPLYYELRLEDSLTRQMTLAVNNRMNFEFFQYERLPIMGFELTANLSQNYRILTPEQQEATNRDPNNIFFDNKVLDRVTLGAKMNIFWFNAGTETTVDILNTRTNSGPNLFVPLAGASFTNRFVGGYPRLVLEFMPADKFSYIPRLTYRYNLFEEPSTMRLTNFDGTVEPRIVRQHASYNMDLVWDLRFRNYQIPKLYPFIYEVSEFGFVMQYYQDFINLRNSFIRFDFVMALKFTKYFTFRFSMNSLNTEVYRYFPSVYNGMNNVRPEDQKNFFEDLGDSFKIWDVDALRRTSFKLQSLNFELIHDLDTWDMRLTFSLGRRVDNIAQVAFWEPTVTLAFKMKGSSAIDIFPEISRSFVPVEFQ